MKKLMMVAILMVITVTAKALSYETARSEALFLSDKMAYELNLSPSQYEAIYEINLDYFMYVGTKLDLYSDLWKQRNYEIQQILTPYQYEEFLRLKYFYRPLGWRDGRWEFRIYRVYPNRGHFMMNRPRAYANYRGGRHFRGGPGGPRPGGPNRVAPGPRPGGPNRVAPGPRGNAPLDGRGAPGPRGNAPRDGRVAPPRSNNFNGPAPRPNEMRGRTTPNGMVQRAGSSSRTTVTTRPNNNQRPPQAQRQQGQRPQQAQRPPQGQRPQGQRPPQGQRQQPPRR
ncbi:MAG: hypothetical protein IJK50_08775 [Prevotella sp.]|nr:hypothetical protein [Prevotella sp.]